MLNARITFDNVNKCSTEEEANATPAATPTSSGEEDNAGGRNPDGPVTVHLNSNTSVIPNLLVARPALLPFQVSPSVFEVPASYHRRGGSRHVAVHNNDEELLQYAIHQSLLESQKAPGQVRVVRFVVTLFSLYNLCMNSMQIYSCGVETVKCP